MRFLPTNFARAKKTEESVSTDVTSLSVSKSESAFEDLMKAVCVGGQWVGDRERRKEGGKERVCKPVGLRAVGWGAGCGCSRLSKMVAWR